MVRQRAQCVRQLEIIRPEAVSPFAQPVVHSLFTYAERSKIGVKSLWVGDEEARMNPEKARKKIARLLRHVRPLTGFQLRQVSLAYGFAKLRLNETHDFGLGDRTIQPT